MTNQLVKNACDILERHGYPREFVVLDFESYFDDDYSLTKMSTWAYVKDKRFEITGLGGQASYDNQLQELKFLKPHEIDNLFSQTNDWWTGLKTVIFQNAKFDQMILQEHYGIKPRYVVDLKHLHLHIRPHTSNRLNDMAVEYGLQPKGDTMSFKGMHWRDIEKDEEVLSNFIDYTKNDVDLEAQLFCMMLPALTNPEMELPLAQHTTKMYLEPAFKFDRELAVSLLKGMQAEIDAAVELSGLTPKQLGSKIEIVDIINAALPGDETCPMKQGKKEKIPALAKDDEGTKYLLNHDCKKVRDIITARQAVKSWPRELCRIEKMIELADACGGKMPVPAKYCGAHTGRWQGEGGINLFNLGGRGRAGKANHPMLGKVRNLLCAEDCQELIIVDSAQIEARVLAWIAGQWDLVEDFRNDIDIYGKFGTGLFGMVVRKSRKDDPPPITALMDINRGFAKDTVLGSGYGMGSGKFYDNCMANIALRPLFDSGKYDFEFVKGLIGYYRKTYAEVPRFWSDIEKMFRWVVKYPHEVMRYAIPGSRLGEHDLLTLWNQGGTVYMQLPSGRCLVYDNARIRKSDNQLLYRSKSPLWGGTLTENICQSIARDLLGYWILECENAEIPVIHHVYDEIISFTVDFNAQIVLDKVMAIMRTVPDWAAGLPVDAEGKITKVYEK